MTSKTNCQGLEYKTPALTVLELGVHTVIALSGEVEEASGLPEYEGEDW